MMTLATSSSTGGAEEDDAVLEQPGVDVVAALAAVGLLDHVGHGDVGHRLSVQAWMVGRLRSAAARAFSSRTLFISAARASAPRICFWAWLDRDPHLLGHPGQLGLQVVLGSGPSSRRRPPPRAAGCRAPGRAPARAGRRAAGPRRGRAGGRRRPCGRTAPWSPPACCRWSAPPSRAAPRTRSLASAALSRASRELALGAPGLALQEVRLGCGACSASSVSIPSTPTCLARASSRAASRRVLQALAA